MKKQIKIIDWLIHRLIFLCILISFSSYAKKQSLIIDNGHDSFQVRLNLINSAKKEILINSFIFKDDLSGNRFLAALVKAKLKRPELKIRIIIDAYLNGISKPKLKYLKNIGIEVKDYAPFNLFRLDRFFKRIHIKMLLIDQEYILIGGRNLEDKYFDLDDKNFRDRDILVRSKEIGLNSAKTFQELWLQEYVKYPRYKKVKREKVETAKNQIHNFIHELHMSEFDPTDTVERYKLEEISDMRIVFDGLTKSSNEGTTQELIQAFNNAKESIVIESPYLVLKRKVKKIIVRQLRKGVKVRIQTSSMTSNAALFSQSAYQRIRPKLVRLGAQLYEYNYQETRLHAKSFLIDNKIAIIGSYNLNGRSYNKDLETFVISSNKEVVESLTTSLDNNLKRYHMIDNKQPLRNQNGEASFGRELLFFLIPLLLILPLLMLIGQL